PDPAPTLRLGLPDCTSTYDRAPSREKAWLTSPGANPTPFIKVPLFGPTLSRALPSAFHHEAIPDKSAGPFVFADCNRTRCTIPRSSASRLNREVPAKSSTRS